MSASQARLAAAQDDLSRCLVQLVARFPLLSETPPTLTVEPGSKHGSRRRTTAAEVVLWAVDDLAQPPSIVVANLAHQLVHVANGRAQVKDCSREYHNREFKRLAESCGLVVAECDGRWGWADALPSPQFLDFCKGLPTERVSLLGSATAGWSARKAWRCGETPMVGLGYLATSRPVGGTRRRRGRAAAVAPVPPAVPAPSYRLILERDETLDRDFYPVLGNPGAAAEVLWSLLEQTPDGTWAALYADGRRRLLATEIFKGGLSSSEPATMSLLSAGLLVNACWTVVGSRRVAENLSMLSHSWDVSWDLKLGLKTLRLPLIDCLAVGAGGTWASTVMPRERRW
jgi:hypothetical protein